MSLLLTIKCIIGYLNGKDNEFGPKKMQNDRYLILLYGATMIEEFKQLGTKRGRLLYFPYNQLKKISKSKLFNSVGPLEFESTRTAREKVYPFLKLNKLVRIEKVNVESYPGAECVAITKKGREIAEKRISDISNGISMDSNAWLNKGIALANAGRFIEAIHYYGIALEIDPRNAGAEDTKAWALINLGNYDKAIQCEERALQIDPKRKEAWDNKAWAYGCLKKYEESLQCIERALQIDPNYAYSLYRKCWTLRELGKPDEAKQYCEKARELGYEG